MGIYPMVIESFEHIEIIQTIKFTIIYGCKRYTEAVLIMFKDYLRIIYKCLIDTSVKTRTHKFIMNLKVFETERHFTMRGNIQRVKYRKSMSSSKNESAVGHAT